MSVESFGRELLGPVIRAHPRATVTHIADLPARAGVTAPWPEWVLSWLREVLVDRGIENLWTHQATTANLAREGVHCVVATGTASGKSLGYLLPVLTELSATPAATALYLSPTKALGADQLDTARAMAPASLSSLISLYDGDTPQDARRAIRDHARWVFTNPICCMFRCSATMFDGHGCCATCAISSSTNAMPIEACSAPTSPKFCVASCGYPASTAPRRP